jgi:spore coat-associated protein N
MAESTLLGVAVATLALAVVGTGAAALFSLGERSAGASSAFVGLGPISVNAPGNRLGVGAMGLSAGDIAQRVVDVTNIGTVALRRVTLATKASPSSRLDTDRVNGLQLTIDRCPVAWTERRAALPSGALTYTCPSKSLPVLASRPVVQPATALASLNSAPRGHNYLRVTLTFPRNAPRTLQGQFSTIRYTFAAT